MTHSPSPGDTPIFRARTPADLKWLLNERAALAGSLQPPLARLRKVTALMQRLEAALSRLAAEETGLQADLAKVNAKLNALDITIGLAYADVDPAAGGIVRAHSAAYGHRGALLGALVEVLKQASPDWLPFSLILLRVAEKFGLDVSTGTQRTKLRDSLWPTLRKLRNGRGTVECVQTPSKHGAVWRWKEGGLDIQVLRDLSSATATPGRCDHERLPNENAAGSEVAGE